MQVSTVLACVNIISSAIAALPLNVYERTVTSGRLGKSLAVDHNLFDLLHNEPNEEMTSFSWRKVLQVHMLLWSNGYAEIERNNANEIIGLWPRNPARTRPVRLTAPATIQGTLYPTGTLVYETSETIGDSQMGNDGTESLDNRLAQRRIILAEDMIHIPGLSFDGRMGQSTVWLARQTFGLALATEKYGAKFFGNNARPAGVLEIPAGMETKAMETLRRSWAEAHGGENAHKTALLEAGVKYQKIGATPEEGQYLETRKFVRTEIATIFNVPPHMVGEATTGKSTVEQSSIELVLYTLGPWITAWEQELRRKLMPKMGRTTGKYFAKFDVRRLLYPDAASRSKFYSTGRQWGFLNGNDIRELEDMDPIPGAAGTAYWMPVNMMDAGDINQVIPPGAPAPDGSVADVKTKQAALAKAAAGKQGTPGMPEEPAKGKTPAQGKGKGKKKARSIIFGAGGGMNPDLDFAALNLGTEDGPAVMRHGTTEYNNQDIYREWTDVDLDEKGKAIVEKTAHLLLGRGIKKIYCTNLKRGCTSADIVSRVLGGIPVIFRDELNTWKHGFGGKTKKEAGADVAYYVEHPDETPPNGESMNFFLKRNQEEIDSHLNEKDSLLITSGSNIASWNQDESDVDLALAGKSEIGPGGFGIITGDDIMVMFAGDDDGKHPS